MKIHIKQPVALNETGGKTTNQDFVYPLKNQANPEEKLFIVCDGNGGPNQGDVAARLVALSLAKYFASTPLQGQIDGPYLQAAVKAAEDSLKAYKGAHPEASKMSAMMSLLHLGDEQITMAWVGNTSPVYYNAKHKKIVPATEDKTTLGGTILGGEEPAEAYFKFVPLEDLNIGDSFFLATDGIKEQVDDHTLGTLFTSGDEATPDFLVGEINNLSQGFTQDNYSCYLVQIEKIEKEGSSTAPYSKTPESETAEAADLSSSSLDKEARRNRRYATIGIVAVLLTLFGILIWNSRKPSYERYRAKAQSLQIENKYSQARAYFDSAIAHARRMEAPDSFLNATIRERNALVTILNIEAGTQIEEKALEELSLSPEQYIEQGNIMMSNGNYQEARTNYTYAQRLLDNDPRYMDKEEYAKVMVPADSMAKALIMVADLFYEQDDRDWQKAENNYAQALTMLEGSDISLEDALVKRTKIRLQACRENLGIAAPGSQDLELLAENTKPQPGADQRTTKSRGLQESSAQPAGNLSDLKEPTAPSRANARVSNLSTRGVDEASMADQRKALATGKRMFVEAKEKSAEYLYLQAAQYLEQAGPALDGAGAYLVAYLYHMGQGVVADRAKALRYAQLSALKGWAAGQYLYGHILLERQYPRDTITARESLIKAADQNYLDAIKRLGQIGN
ncbi:MAG: protein phosphatase 2C domain-containing protein [Bacteroidota bacterium]